MKTKFKALLIFAVSAISLNFLPMSYVYSACTCWGDAATVWTTSLGTFGPFVNNLVGGFGDSTEKTIVESNAGVRAEVLKSAMASKAVDEGIEAYHQEQDIRESSAKLEDSMKQPATTCQSLATSNNLSAANQNAQARVYDDHSKFMEQVASNPNTGQRLEKNHATTNENYCSLDEKAQGICKINNSAGYQKLSGADQDAAFLFQGTDGSSSYDSVDTDSAKSPQSAAVDGYIGRIVAALPPENIRTGDGANLYKNSPLSRVYIELTRRYEAMMSVSAYSLRQIKEYHNTQKGLGTATKMDNVSAPGFASGKADMSPAEVVERFVASKFSPTSVTGLVDALEPHVILRDMAQMSAFQLRMSYQAMLQSSRTESIAAHQLVLMAEQTLRPQIDAQRSAAASASGKVN